MSDKRRNGGKIRCRTPVTRRLLGAALVVFAVVAAIFLVSRAAAPYLVSSTLVRSAMERAVAEWTGHDVNMSGMPEIAFWPRPHVTLNGVTISKPDRGKAKILGQIEQVSASFGLLSAMRGRPQFDAFDLVRPRFHVDRDSDGRLDWASEGLLNAAVRKAEPGNDGVQSLPAELDAAVGSVTIEDGTLEIEDEASGRLITARRITADVSWPRLSSPLKVSGLVDVGGFSMKLDFASPHPLLLFGGKDATVNTTLTSAAFTARFDGVANLGNSLLRSGAIALGTKDFAALKDATGLRLVGLDSLRQAQLTANIERVGEELRFEGLEFDINDTHGTGILSLSRPADGKPRISGTLAFDRLNITRLLSAFSLDLPSTDESPDTAQRPPRLLQWLDFDLTLSAARADLPPFELGDVAASILATGKAAQFDIADATFEGGDLTARFVGAGSGFARGGDLTLSIHDADFAAVADHLKVAGPVARGKGSVELTLTTKAPVWETGLSDISGTFAFASQSGTLTGVNTAALRKLAATSAYFQLSAGGDGSMPYDRLDYRARFAKGTAEVLEAQLSGPDESLTVSGVVPYADNALALSAELFATDPAANLAFPRLRFFIGGAWPDPVLTPIYLPPANPLK
ncbi:MULTISPECIES: AsmA family protein [Alphaproteobacteria]|uniref:Cell envelope biogenesis protein AsmA n=2 Tax=Alphaproteobacteria TaxID=28211 RepID=A0A512HIC7_9HYPH|nr:MULTISPECIES: AsmA-like C-terminal region-containing protein [Alphaproteobacteria]GEO85201.1 cell envelope biogenesis protein AsmA [Ciceribacter naphthalenivorans]GLR24465.1 cell envelope biogenesis protein AsmA [Ciceribacter naphthalenivorans]GLT07321.1 cell envelope biogenesis protein AsmA [Sphingomonas psychrolutea]